MKKFFIGLLIGLMVLAFTPLAFADNSVQIFVNGQQIQTDVPPQVIDGRTMVPIRPVAEALGAGVVWSDSSVYIATNESPQSNSSSSKWPSEWPSEWQNTNKTVTIGTEKDLFYSYLIFNKGFYALSEVSKKNLTNLTDKDKWIFLGAMNTIDNANDYIVSKVFLGDLKTIQSDMIDTYTVNKTAWWLLWQSMLDKNNPESALKALRASKAIMEYESSIIAKRPSCVWYDNNRLTLGSKYGNPDPELVISSKGWAQWLKSNEFRIKTFPKTVQ